MAWHTAASSVEAEARRFFFRPAFGNAAVLREGVSNYRHKGVTVKTCQDRPSK